MATGKIKTLFSDKEKTEALFPRTKISAISDDDGTGLDAILENLGGNIDHPVDSVNGKTGAVQLSASDVSAVPTTRKINNKALSGDITLSASDVGARASTWTPTASDVGAVPTSRTINNKALSSNITLTASDVSARPSTWMPTASDVGAAPSGYGLGVTTPPTIDGTEALDACHTSGFYRYKCFGSNICGVSFNFANLIVYTIYTDECVQELRPLNSNYCLRRYWFDGSWSSWESTSAMMKLLWVNASPTSNFAAQTISMDLSKYQAVYVQSVRATNDSTVSGEALVWIDMGPSYLMGTTEQYAATRRTVYATTTGITFSGFYSANTSNGTSNEIPLAICGVEVIF